MKAMVFDACGGPEEIHPAEVPTPTVGLEDVLIQVKACSLNHMDLFVRRGPAAPEAKSPFWGLADVAGVVSEVGAGVDAWRPGDRVIVNPALSCGACEFCRAGEDSLCVDFKILGDEVPGGAAEYLAIPARSVQRLPDDFGFEEAAAVPLVFLTAWRALTTQAQLKPGEDVLILGASGGVATAAIQIAKLAGARVLAVTSGAEKVARVGELGADLVFDRNEVDFAREALRSTHDRGVDVVLENVGTPTWKQSLQCLARAGRLVSYGRTAGMIGETNIRELFVKQTRIIGTTMGNRREFAEVTRLVFARRLRPIIDRVLPLEQLRAAHERLEAGAQFGKIVLSVAS
ncbi:MAG: zinc-binding dehydrogenase [Deltaproteobacteria bacterium]|jgi:NADPH:quinone reductase-like Zn-dependent oxidoreductase|nr:zinc-binding dehydrogenase [Deltaproteobacteria bacterium]